MTKFFPVFAFIVLVVTSCQQPVQKQNISFCYWDSDFSIDSSRYKSFGVNHFYVRYFDVDWDDKTLSARPVATLNVTDSVPDTFTPVIFITHEVFEKLDDTGIDSLASRTKRRIDHVTESFVNAAWYQREAWLSGDSARLEIEKTVHNRYKAILIDCDWTAQSRDKFFRFIEKMKNQFPGKEIEVTLRLWQYKYRDKAGIPPVKKALLMCYNMQTANDFSVTNSIATIDELKKYITEKTYPVSLDIALPVFSWAVLFRNEKSVGLIGNADRNEYENNVIDYRKISDNQYELLTEKVIGNFFARKGDVIRMESVEITELVEMAEYLHDNIKTDEETRITFFSWNKKYLNNYEPYEIHRIESVFSH